jgi:hypothetical protein
MMDPITAEISSDFLVTRGQSIGVITTFRNLQGFLFFFHACSVIILSLKADITFPILFSAITKGMMSQFLKLFTVQTHFVLFFSLIRESLTENTSFLGEFPSIIVIGGITYAIEDLSHVKANCNASSKLISTIEDEFCVVDLYHFEYFIKSF